MIYNEVKIGDLVRTEKGVSINAYPIRSMNVYPLPITSSSSVIMPMDIIYLYLGTRKWNEVLSVNILLYEEKFYAVSKRKTLIRVV